MKPLKKLSMAVATAIISLSAIAEWNDELTLQDTKTMSGSSPVSSTNYFNYLIYKN